MVIHRDTWHYKFWRWACEWFSSSAPSSTNLCRYVQRIFWSGFALFALTAMVLVLIGTFALAFWQRPLFCSAIVAGVVAVIGGYILLMRWLEVRRYARMMNPKPPSLVGQWVAAKKQKICPLVEFEN